MRPILWCSLLLVLGCGSSQEQPAPKPAVPDAPATPFGTVAEVKAYLDKIAPHIQLVSQLQAELDRQIGTAGKVTSKNLAAAAAAAIPRLRQAHEEFARLQPPPLLAPLHRDIEKLMVLRLDAYSAAAEGWQREQQNGDTAWHTVVETKLQGANDLIVQLNQQLQQVNGALAQTTTQVARP